MATTPSERDPQAPAVVRSRALPVHSATVLQPGEDPVESLRAVRRAVVGRWWIRVQPLDEGFRGEAHTMSGPPGVWAGEVRATLAEATADAVAIITELRRAG